MGYPDNGAYMIAAYVVTAIVLIAYSVGLVIRFKKEMRDRSD